MEFAFIRGCVEKVGSRGRKTGSDLCPSPGVSKESPLFDLLKSALGGQVVLMEQASPGPGVGPVFCPLSRVGEDSKRLVGLLEETVANLKAIKGEQGGILAKQGLWAPSQAA